MEGKSAEKSGVGEGEAEFVWYIGAWDCWLGCF